MYQTLHTIFIFTTHVCTHRLKFPLSCGLLFHVTLILVIKETSLKTKKPFKHSTCPYLSQVQLFVTSWNFPDKNSGVDCHFLLQRIFQTHASNPDLLQFLHWQVDSLPLCHLGSPIVLLCSIIAYLLYKGKDSTLDRFYGYFLRLKMKPCFFLHQQPTLSDFLTY